MKGYIYIDNDLIGEANFQIVDESMGAIGGEMIPYNLYKIYRNTIQALYIEKGVANSDNFNFKIMINKITLKCEGGVGITHSVEFDNEIYIEATGLNFYIEVV